jgi:predicted RNA-binding Zn ribbon-like protein
MTNTDLICEFVNTKDILDGGEGLARPADLAAWCSAHALAEAGARATAVDLRHAIELREALRELLLANNGVELDTSSAFEVLDGVACRARVGLRCRDGASALVPAASGIKGALGSIVAEVHSAIADGSWLRLKACRARDCEWAFVDHAKNQSRAWCSMRVCGNREKARVYRERQRSAGSAKSSSR